MQAVQQTLIQFRPRNYVKIEELGSIIILNFSHQQMKICLWLNLGSRNRYKVSNRKMSGNHTVHSPTDAHLLNF